MICYKDMTFCSHYETCKDGEHCHRSLTPAVQKDADDWWEFDSPAPIAAFKSQPTCHKEKKLIQKTPINQYPHHSRKLNKRTLNLILSTAMQYPTFRYATCLDSHTPGSVVRTGIRRAKAKGLIKSISRGTYAITNLGIKYHKQQSQQSNPIEPPHTWILTQLNQFTTMTTQQLHKGPYNESQIHNSLYKLKKQNKVENPYWGVYTITNLGRQFLEPIQRITGNKNPTLTQTCQDTEVKISRQALLELRNKLNNILGE